ncbi:MAG TPA: S8 family serine peptidase [Nonomuraea sp.]|nr:S8 family serine peptidase [Nonomuraea sp.]
MRPRSPRARATALATALAAASALLCASPAVHAEAADVPDVSPRPSPLDADNKGGSGAGGPVISPSLIKEIRAKTRVRSIIQLKPGQSVQAVAGDIEHASESSRVLESAASPHFFVAEVDQPTLARLKKDGRVQAVYKDELRPSALDASTVLIRSNRANAAGWNGRGTTIAVLDTGLDTSHGFFSRRVVGEACFSSSDAGDGAVSLCPNNQPTQTGAGAASATTAQCVVNGTNSCAHGSHVAGIAAGRMVAGAPANGVAPEAGILPIQVFSRVDNALTCGLGGRGAPCFLSYTSDQKLALEYVARVVRTHNVAAVNMSIGGGGPYTQACDNDVSAAAIKPELDRLVSLGVAPVVAAGNNGFTSGVASPACISTAITVGATDDSDALASFTNRGPLLDVLAPGVNIRSAVPGGTYADKSGTSMAAPHVAGLFALMKQAFPANTVQQSLERLRSTGTSIRYDAGGTAVATPRIDAERATAGGTRAAA